MKEFDKKSSPSREGFSKFLPASMSDSSTRRRLTEYEIQVQDLQAYIRSLEAETVHLRKKLEDTPKDFMVLENKLREAMVALESRRLDNWKSKVTAGKGGKPKLAVVSVVQSKLGFCLTQRRQWSSAIVKGSATGGVVFVEFAKPAKDAPGSSPYHRNSPCVPRAPRQICRTASASWLARQVPSVGAPGRPHTNKWGSNRHWRGSLMTPSITPSSPSHALMAAAVTAVSLVCGTGSPTSRFMTTSGQSSAGMKRSQLNAGAPARIPS